MILTKTLRASLISMGIEIGGSRSKYRNVKVEVDGIKFDSKREAESYRYLQRLKLAGEIRGFARQVSIPLPSGKRRLVLDFMVVGNDGKIEFIDIKGVVTKDWAVKRDELEHALGIKISVRK